MVVKHDVIDGFLDGMDEVMRSRIDKAVDKIVSAKQEQQRVVVATGSGPNIHEGVTTLIAELIKKGVVDGVLTSSAVVAHEMAGSLDRVKRVNADLVSLPKLEPWQLPRGNVFELTRLTARQLEEIGKEMEIDMNLVSALEAADGKEIIKAAGNMAYPMGLRTELLAGTILDRCRDVFHGRLHFEEVAGLGADPKTMIGAAMERNLREGNLGVHAGDAVKVLVSVPQLVGGGNVGICIADATTVRSRCRDNAAMLGSASVIIESGLALAQEIHDGPFETYTGHGIWSAWQGDAGVFSLKGKALVRIDLDPNLEKAWEQERGDSLVQKAIDEGKPKTKITGVPFRMEMSGFARLESSIPVIADLGEAWPVIASKACKDLGIKLDFMSYKQETPEGQAMRDFIADHVTYISRPRLEARIEELAGMVK